MSRLLVLLLLSLNILRINGQISATSSLKAVAVLHRHGDRTPIATYPNDPWGNITYWPDGWGQLTISGKKRLYDLGQYVRTRYSNFLSDNPLEVHVRSSGVNRCIQSTALLLAGAYPPKGRWQWDNDLPWQPFPIMTKPKENDGMLYPAAKCPAMEEERLRVQQSQEYQDFVAKYADLFSYCAKNSGANVTTIQNAEYLFDDLHIERANGYKLPLWVKDDVYDQLKHISDMSFYFEFNTLKLQRFRTGLFFKDLLDNFRVAKYRGSKERQEYDGFWPKKLHVYASHDTLVAGALSSLKSFNKLAPPYAATLFFELHRINRTDLINIYYLNDTYARSIHPITPPGCRSPPSPCPLEDFAKALEPIIPDDWEAECNTSFISKYNLPGEWTVFFCFTFFFVPSLVALSLI